MSIEGAMETIDELRRQRDAAIQRAEQAEQVRDAWEAHVRGRGGAAMSTESRAKVRAKLKAALIAAGRTEKEAEVEIQLHEAQWAFSVGPREMFP